MGNPRNKAQAFQCQCRLAQHVLIMEVDAPGEEWRNFYINTQLRSEATFWSRMKLGLRYIFTAEAGQMGWAETVLTEDEARDMAKFIITNLSKAKPVADIQEPSQRPSAAGKASIKGPVLKGRRKG